MRFPAIAVVALLVLAFPSCVIQMDDPASPSAAPKASGAQSQSPQQSGGGDDADAGQVPAPARAQGDAYAGFQVSFHMFDMEDKDTDYYANGNIDSSVALTADCYSPISADFGAGIVGGLSKSRIGESGQLSDGFFSYSYSTEVDVYRAFIGPAVQWSPSTMGAVRPYAGIGFGLELTVSDGSFDTSFGSVEFDSDGTGLGMFFRPSFGMRIETGADIAFDVGVAMHFSEPFDGGDKVGHEEEEAMLTLGFAIKL